MSTVKAGRVPNRRKGPLPDAGASIVTEFNWTLTIGPLNLLGYVLHIERAGAGLGECLTVGLRILLLEQFLGALEVPPLLLAPFIVAVRGCIVGNEERLEVIPALLRPLILLMEEVAHAVACGDDDDLTATVEGWLDRCPVRLGRGVEGMFVQDDD